jgi:Protein of unknown function (DUF3379)
MIDCTQFRRAILADPRDPNPELKQHLESCSICPAYTERLLRFEGRFERALRVGVPQGGRPQPIAPRMRAPWRNLPMGGGWLAVTASVLFALVVGGGLWLAAPHPSLAADVVAHMAEEPQAWARTDVPVAASELAGVLRDSHMRLDPNAGMVSYAQSCLFRGHRVPHLVVQTEMGPVTVMVLVHESVTKPMPFDEEGYRGVIIPISGHGSLAVLARDQDGDLNAVKRIAARVESAIVWTD